MAQTTELPYDNPLAESVTQQLKASDVEGVRATLAAHPELARTFVRGNDDCCRSLMHLFLDFPGNRPQTEAMLELLLGAGMDVNIHHEVKTKEGPLHWAASNDDVAAIEVLLRHGANQELTGGCIADGTPIFLASCFGQYKAVAALVAGGSQAGLWMLALAGRLDLIQQRCAPTASPRPTDEDTASAFWSACRTGRLEIAQWLHANVHVDINHCGYDDDFPLDIARAGKHAEVVSYLESLGAKANKVVA